jgi:hypothetical protein
MPDYDRQNLSFWSKIKIRLEPVGFVFFFVGIFILVLVFIVPTSAASQINLLGISLALFSVGLGLVAIGMSAKSDTRYTEILLRMDTNLTKVLDYYKPSEDKLEFPPDLSRNVVIKPPPATAYADVAAPKVEVTTPELSRAKAQARLDADTKKVGYIRGEPYQKEDGSWGIHWGGKYPL